jgi:fatty acid synthase subunit alpha
MSHLLTSHAVTFPTAPNVEINEKGDIIVTEVVREGVRKLEAYVEEMSSSNAVNAPIKRR